MDEAKLRKYLIIANVWLFIAFILMDLRTWALTTEFDEDRRQHDTHKTSVLIGHVTEQYQKGKRLFSKCAICHHMNRNTPNFGPKLSCILGQPIARAGDIDYRYSSVLESKGVNGDHWDLSNLRGFIGNPQVFAPGTRMPFEGLEAMAENMSDENASGADEMTRQIVYYLAWSCVGGISESIDYDIYTLVKDSSGYQYTCEKSSLANYQKPDTYVLPKTKMAVCSDN